MHKEFCGVVESNGAEGPVLIKYEVGRLGPVGALKADKRKALCQCCDRIIEVSNMGESALKSHPKIEKHKQSRLHYHLLGINSRTDLHASLNSKLEN